jgi:excisionase family DNA binding protein
MRFTVDQLVTTAELAAKLNVSPGTIRLWAQEGVIPEIRVRSNVVRYDPDEVYRALKERSAARPACR